MLYFFLVPAFIILALFGYLFYSDYRDNIVFRGESFSESHLSRKLIDFFMPNEKAAKRIDNNLFYLTHTKTVRDFTMMKVIILFFSIIMSASIVYTNYLNDRATVFTKERELPVKISESELETLRYKLSFQQIDYQTDLNRLNSNITKVEDVSKFIAVDGELLYQTIKTMIVELESCFGFKSILTFIAIIIAMWYLPNIILKLLDSMLGRDLFFEYSRLESYIYMNADKRVDQIIRGLTYEAVIFRAPFTEFLTRYREDSAYAYDLVLTTRGCHMKFKRLVEYLKLLDNTSPSKAREKIAVHQANNLRIVENMYLYSIEKKKSICKTMIYVAIFINIIAIGVGIVTSINFGALGGY